MADILARFVLVSWLEGSKRRAKVELELLNRLFPDASGKLAGKTVRYAEHLKSLISTSVVSNESDYFTKNWGTFAGNFQRNAAVVKQEMTELKKVWATETHIQSQPGLTNDFTTGRDRIAEDAKRINYRASFIDLAWHPITET